MTKNDLNELISRHRATVSESSLSEMKHVVGGSPERSMSCTLLLVEGEQTALQHDVLFPIELQRRLAVLAAQVRTQPTAGALPASHPKMIYVS